MKLMKLRKILSEQRGGVAIMVAVSAVVLLSFAALVIDIGYGLVVKNQLHNVADAASLAGTSCLGIIYAGGSRPACGTYPAMSYAEQQSYTLTSVHRAAIIAEVQDAAEKNGAGGISIGIAEGDIRIGQWDVPTHTLTVTDTRPTAVEVTARRDGTANGPISTFLGNIMGISSLNVRATSVRDGQPEEPTAALTGLSYVPPGELEVPVGISSQRFTAEHCNTSIKFYPTNTYEGCAGWTTFDLGANANNLDTILTGLKDGSYESPEVYANQDLNFFGGNVAGKLKDLRDLYEAKDPEDGVKDGRWTTLVVVYQSSDCSNPGGNLKIVGFAEVTITNVLAPPAGQLIEGQIVCGAVESGRGGGAEFGAIGSIPGLVR